MNKLFLPLLLLLALFGCNNESNEPKTKTAYVEPNVKIIETYNEPIGNNVYSLLHKIQNINDGKCYFLIHSDFRSLTSIPTPCEDKPKQ